MSSTAAEAGQVLAANDDRVTAAGQRGWREGGRRRLPVMIVCSARPRVGRTLIARLLVEYFVADGRRPLAFDVNPNDPVLSDWLPAHAIRATIADTRGQMALFDRLIVNDGRPKVVDLASDLFHAFFDVLRQIEFVAGARAGAVDTAALFVVEDHPRSLAAYHRIIDGVDGILVVPVRNDLDEAGSRYLPPPSPGATPIHIGCLPQVLLGVVNRPRFSFADYHRKPSPHPTMLNQWISRSFVAFRDLELRLLMAEFAPLFRSSA